MASKKKKSKTIARSEDRNKEQTARTTCKIGMIFESGKQGPDAKVCKHLIKMLQQELSLPEITISIAENNGLPDLLEHCGNQAASLLQQDGCERVIIMWDLEPPRWEEQSPSDTEVACLHNDRENIFQSLAEAGVQFSNVYLVCLDPMMESWLLADKRALKAFLEKKWHPHPLKKRVQYPEISRDPKSDLIDFFKKMIGRRYIDHEDAERIITKLPDLKRLQECQTFNRFVQKLTGRPYP